MQGLNTCYESWANQTTALESILTHGPMENIGSTAQTRLETRGMISDRVPRLCDLKAQLF